MRFTASLIGAAAFIAAAPVLQADPGDTVEATLEGKGIKGKVRMVETASGIVHVTLAATGVPEGIHGFHVHEKGECDAGDGFKSAGDHLSRGLKHGIMAGKGPHPGDLPNVHAGRSGEVRAEFFTRGFTLDRDGEKRLLDDNGSAVVLHADADDYESQPSGKAGDRLACGVLKAER